jgi:pimeloyl-ACP methyl ester carboxylesterase
MTRAISGFAKGAGADLYFERRGDGPPLLMIAGGGGDCGGYTAVAGLLASDYTVITYDRRGNSRSRLHGSAVKIGMVSQSADAVAVLAANGFKSARVFGNSGGATIALDLAAYRPAVVETAVIHEPPVPRVLPEAGEYFSIYDEIDRARVADGWESAFRLFQIKIGHMSPDNSQAFAALLNPASVLPPGPVRDIMTRLRRNWPYMMTYEMRSFIDYEPDVNRIATNRLPIVVACGADTQDPVVTAMCTRTAELIGAECVELCGGHLAPAEIPGPFAAELSALLARLDKER